MIIALIIPIYFLLLYLGLSCGNSSNWCGDEWQQKDAILNENTQNSLQLT